MNETSAVDPDRRNPSRGRKLVSRFADNRSGSTAIEFAMLVLPFSLIVFAILETCLAFAAQEMMANAANSVARQLRTGQLRAETLDQAKLRELICQPLELLVANGCPDLAVDLRHGTFDELNTASKDWPVKGTGAEREIDSAKLKFEPGGTMTPNMLRVFYSWPVMTDLLRKQLSTMKGGKTLLFTASTWQNEPY